MDNDSTRLSLLGLITTSPIEDRAGTPSVEFGLTHTQHDNNKGLFSRTQHNGGG